MPLLSRTTRRVTLTEEGSRYYDNCIQILRLVEQAGDEARGARGTPAGTIRISCTAALGVLHVIEDLLADGRLEVILPSYSPPPVPLNMLIVPGRAAIARIRLLVDFLSEHIACLPGISAKSHRPGAKRV